LTDKHKRIVIGGVERGIAATYPESQIYHAHEPASEIYAKDGRAVPNVVKKELNPSKRHRDSQDLYEHLTR